MADEPTTELTKSEEIAGAITVTDRGISISNIDDLFRFAQMVHQSRLAPEAFGTPQAIMVAVEMGLELGIKPMASLRTIAVINGRPCLWGDGMLGVVRASGLMEWIEETIEGEGDNMVAICRTQRRGDPKPCERNFSAGDAKTAGLWAGMEKKHPKLSPWFKYPGRMLKMRARAFCLRDNFSDVLAGCITAEEAQDIDAERATFDPAQALGDKAENLAKSLTAGHEVVAEQRPDPPSTRPAGDEEPTNVEDSCEVASTPSAESSTSAGDPNALIDCSECDGRGGDDDGQCDMCGGTGLMPAPNPTPTPDESTPSNGQDSSTKDTGGEPVGDNRTIPTKRFDDLCSLVLAKSEWSVQDSQVVINAWLKKRKHPDIADLADDGTWKILFSAAQRQDWEKFKADNPKLLGD